MKYLLSLILLSFSVAAAGDLKDLQIGDTAPAFTLKNYDGREYNLKNSLRENKLTVVLFVSTQCPVSNAYNERMVKLYDDFGKKGVAFLGINANKAEDTASIAQHAKEHGFKFPILKDERNKVADLYAAQVTPEAFVIGSSGKLLYHGRIDDNRRPEKVTSNDLSDTLTRLLEGREVVSRTPRAFGCSIKRID